MMHAPRRPPNDTGGPPLPIFLINLNQSVGRLRKMEAQLDGDRWSRVSAVYGDNVWPGCLQNRHGAGRSGCAADTVGSGAQGTPRLHPRSAAVAFSHMRAWRKVEALPPHPHSPSYPYPSLLTLSLPPNPIHHPNADPDPGPNPGPEQVEALPLGGEGAAIVLEDDVKLRPGAVASKQVEYLVRPK